MPPALQIVESRRDFRPIWFNTILQRDINNRDIWCWRNRRGPFQNIPGHVEQTNRIGFLKFDGASRTIKPSNFLRIVRAGIKEAIA